MTRKAGFSARAAVELQRVRVDGYRLARGQRLDLVFHLPTVKAGERLGFGGWFIAPRTIGVEIAGTAGPFVLQQAESPNWSKFGSQWVSDGAKPDDIRLRFEASAASSVALWDVLGGRVDHEYLHHARAALMKNMWQFAPEGNFYEPSAQARVEVIDAGLHEAPDSAEIWLKSCNRCGRFLPVNLDDERFHLSFSNHCVATHRRPCRHSGFGRILNITDDLVVQLDYGFQLECRFCKKFEVNAAHNPQRTAAQMKEDGARRRAIELLLEHLYEGTPQLRYRQRTGRELADDVWQRFGGRCFKCGTALSTSRDMHLDHTRPLALLWPVDYTATALCATHNSEKRDRPPVGFYTAEELERLSEIVGIPLSELQDPSPNRDAIEQLGNRLNWFFDEFLTKPELMKTRDGKRAADLLVKAIQKALLQLPDGPPYNLEKLWKERQRKP
ncbi:MAG: hypothetical protein M0Z66_16125 [Thermaerobacter sp.]|jgi:hypothetical protein|nr:hypothetical protein [Thermaerobacter sp.]